MPAPSTGSVCLVPADSSANSGIVWQFAVSDVLPSRDLLWAYAPPAFSRKMESRFVDWEDIVEQSARPTRSRFTVYPQLCAPRSPRTDTFYHFFIPRAEFRFLARPLANGDVDFDQPLHVELEGGITLVRPTGMPASRMSRLLPISPAEVETEG